MCELLSPTCAESSTEGSRRGSWIPKPARMVWDPWAMTTVRASRAMADEDDPRGEERSAKRRYRAEEGVGWYCRDNAIRSLDARRSAEAGAGDYDQHRNGRERERE